MIINNIAGLSQLIKRTNIMKRGKTCKKKLVHLLVHFVHFTSEGEKAR